MKIERNQFAVTSILDRSGKRVGNYIVDRSKDSLEREKKEQQKPEEDDEAVVVHSVEADSPTSKGAVDVELKVLSGSNLLNITV
jgi:hypothetical protein